jgi:23S rRNA pseudouridine2605 synthase
MMHPRQEVDKTYRVTVMGYTPQALELVKRPIVLDGYRIKPPQVELEQAADGRAVLEITIHEGRNRQVRRMCAAAGMPVKRLVRIREGAVTLGELPLGKWRYLSDEEIQLLYAEAGI